MTVSMRVLPIALLSVALAATSCSREPGTSNCSLGGLTAGMTLANAKSGGLVVECTDHAVLTTTDPHDFNRRILEGTLSRTDPTRQICHLPDQSIGGVPIVTGSAMFGPGGLDGVLVNIAEADYDRAKASLTHDYGVPCNRDDTEQSSTTNGSVREADPYAVGGYSDRPTSQTTRRVTDSASWCFAAGQLKGQRFTFKPGLSSFSFSTGSSAAT